MKHPLLPRLGVLAAALLLSHAAPAAETALPRATPESQGIASAGLQALVDEAEARAYGLHSIMILRHGKVVAEGWWAPYAATEPHMLFSLSKSFTSTAIGMLQAEGRLDIHDKLVSFFPDEVPADAPDNLKNMRLRDLLMMSTGQEKADVDKINVNAPDGTGTRQFLAAPVKQKPGTLFYYNSPATFMLSATVQKVTGQTVRDYLVSRLFEPLGIPTPNWDTTPQGYNLGASGLHLRTEDIAKFGQRGYDIPEFEPLGIPTPNWDTTPQGYNLGASGLHLRTEDIAKFGQLLLQRGEWNGRRLLPAEWVDLATSRQASNGSAPDGDWDQGYGFQFWRCVPGFYRADGAFGQYCIVMPQHDTVVAINSGTRDMGGIMKMLWAKLLPELRAAPLPENPAAQAALSARLAGLTFPTQAGAATSQLAAQVSGKRYTFAAGEGNPAGLESVTLDVAADGAVTLTTVMRGRDQKLAAGYQRWIKAEVTSLPGGPQPAAVSGAWTADDTYAVQVYRYRTPFIHTLTLKFSGDEVTAQLGQNVGFGQTQPPALTGKAQ